MTDLNIQIRDYLETTAPAVEVGPVSVVRPTGTRSGWVVAAAAGTTAVLVIGVPAFFLLSGDGNEVATQAPVSSTIEPVAPRFPIVAPLVEGGAAVVESPALLLGGSVTFARSGDTLWAWDAEGSIAAYRDGAWRSLPPIPGTGLDVTGAPDGTGWALTRTASGPSARSTLWHLQAGRWSGLPEAAAASIGDAEDIEIDTATGIIWLGDPNGMLHRWDGMEMSTSSSPQLEMVFDRIALTRDGTVWTSRFNPTFPARPAGLLRYHPEIDVWEEVRPLGGDENIPGTLAATPSGDLWVLLATPSESPGEPPESAGSWDYPTDWSLAFFESTTQMWTIYSVPTGQPGEMVADDEVVWMTHSSLGGSAVLGFDGATWTTYRSDQTIDGFGIGADGTLWASVHPTNRLQRLMIDGGS